MVVEQVKLALMLLYSVLLGLFFGVVYGIFKFRRLCFPLRQLNARKSTQKMAMEDVIVFFEDVLFAFVCGVSTCIFIYYTNAGRFRGIVLVGSLLGFVVYYNTIGKLVLKLSALFMRFVCSLIKKIFTVLPVFKLLMYIFDLTIGWLFAVVFTFIRQLLDVFFADNGFWIIKKKDE